MGILKKHFFRAFLFLLSHTIIGQNLEDSISINSKGYNCYNVIHYDLTVRFDVRHKSISGNNIVSFNLVKPTSFILLDLQIPMIVDSILLQNQQLKFSRVYNSLFVNFEKEYSPAKKTFQIKIYFHGKPTEAINPPWDGGFVWSKDSTKKDWIGVACEELGASSWWPCKENISDQPDSVNLNFIVPAHLKCISNGKLVSHKFLDNNSHLYQWKTSYPIANYNVTFYIGDYEFFGGKFSTPADTFSLNYYVLKPNLQKAQHHFSQVDTILKAYSHFFGSYPYKNDGYKLVEAPYRGMEHQTAIAYGNNYKTDYCNDFIILHESAHEWWGNNVRANNISDMWIHESFTTYSEWLFYEYTYGFETAKKYALFQKSLIKNEKPIISPNKFENALSNIDIYYKGAWILHTLRNLTESDSLWFSTLKNVQTYFGNKATSTDELIQYFTTQLNFNVSNLLNYYLKTCQLPILKYKIVTSDKKSLVYYQWNTENNYPLNMTIQIMLDNKPVNILPLVNTWKNIDVKKNQLQTLKFSSDKYLIDYIQEQ